MGPGAADNDGAEFREFMLGCQSRMVRVANLLARDRHRAEDLVQHAFAKAYAAWPRIRDGSPEAYVRRCLVNAYTDWWRRRTWWERPTEELAELSETAVAASQQVPDHAADLAERDAVARLLTELTAKERAVIVLRFYCSLSEAEIARELRVRPGTVKSTAARALARLRAAAEALGEVA